ncbi:hypothetical protein V500_02376 [Pseudogymnoascus sp. VKM F-4518 (FW-2643)]|nr:hypothetical protein V500_02376 [Pseudogymnoascus sp. VKM F-4518 (FW-2643)]
MEEERPMDQDDEGRLSERLPTSSATADARMFQEDHVATPHIAAYQVSSTRRATQVAFATLACCLASGIIFGFAALKPVLIAEGVYHELCDHNDMASSGFNHIGSTPNSSKIPCAEQDLRLNLFFVLTSIMSNVSTLLAGIALDRFGRRFCYIVSSVTLAIGCILMGSASAIRGFDAYIVGNLFLGLGGTFLFVSSFQLATAFPKYSGTVVALVTGAFDASAAVFLFYRLAYDASNGRISLTKFFFGYLTVPVLIIVAEFAFMPPQAYQSAPEIDQKIKLARDSSRDEHDSDSDISDDRELRRVRCLRAERRVTRLEQIEDLVGNPEERQERVDMVGKRQVISGVWGILHGVPAHKQLLSPWFILLLLLTVMQMLRMNYFIATIRAQYRYMLNSDDDARAINHFFDVALPTAGIISTPFIGLLLNNFSVTKVLLVLTIYIVIIGILNCLSFVWAGYVTVVAFVLFRPLYYSTVSDYATKVFGFETFGRIYGTTMCLSGLGNFVQPGLDELTHGLLSGNPVPVNIFLAIVGTLLGVAITGFVAVETRGIRKKHMIEDVEHEQARLISSEDGGL